jgi:hypothetical protein
LGCIPTGCSNTTSRRYYSVAVRNLTSPDIDVVSNGSQTAGGLETSRDGNIFFSGSSGSGSSRNFWFCRGNAGGGTTHVRTFVVRVRGTATTTTTTPAPNGPTQFSGSPGGTTFVNRNGARILTATGGGGGGFNSNTRVPGGGGSPGGLSGTSQGGGGGSGKVSGGSNSSGSGRAGGTGEGFGGTTNSGGSAAGSQGGSGGQYGGGGGAGSSANGLGGNGGGGAVRFSWTAPAAASFTYNQVVTQIFSAFWQKGNRGPIVSEVQTWVNNFKNNPTTYPDLSSLFNAITVTNLGPTPPVDNCDVEIPRFP